MLICTVPVCHFGDSSPYLLYKLDTDTDNNTDTDNPHFPFRISDMQTLRDGTYTCVANHEFGPEATHKWYIITSNLQAPRNVRISKSSDQKLYYGQGGFYLSCVSGEPN